jgi:hypothetical protein
MRNKPMTTIIKNILTMALPLFFAVSCSTTSKEEKKQTPINTLNDVLTNLKPQVETFQIKSNEENLITGEKGTTIYIPPDAFQFSDGSIPSGNVILTLKECYSLKDMIAENLSTISQYQILQTAGMIEFKATADGRELLVKNGKAFVIGFPKNSKIDTMDLFYDFKDNSGSKTWIADYKMFEAEAISEAQKDTTIGEGDRSLNLKYPIEMTEDLYDYGLTSVYMTSTFSDIKLVDQDKTILDYINDPENISDSIAKLFIKNDWRVHFNFNIDKNGKINNFRVENDEYTKYNNEALKITEDFFRKAPQFDLSSYKEKVNYDWDYSLGIMGSRQINWDRFKTKFREQFAEYKNKAIQKLDKTALDFYMFSATKLGWINCDKFWDTTDEKIDFIVKTPNANESKIQIVFNDINSIMNGTLKGNQFIFNNVPVNRKIKVIGISYINGKPTMSSLTTKINKDGAQLGAFKEFSLDELETELNKKN